MVCEIPCQTPEMPTIAMRCVFYYSNCQKVLLCAIYELIKCGLLNVECIFITFYLHIYVYVLEEGWVSKWTDKQKKSSTFDIRIGNNIKSINF